jgi:hypothetical protein
VLHECLTGVTPYSADTPMAFIARKLDTTVSLAAPRLAMTRDATTEDEMTGALARELEALVVEMTRPQPADRPTAAALADRLGRMG